MAIKVIVELQATPGQWAGLKSLLESVVAKQGPSAPGFLGSTRYEVLDNPDILVEIADWESTEARAAHMQEVVASGAYAPPGELLAAPIKATAISQLPGSDGFVNAVLFSSVSKLFGHGLCLFPFSHML